MFPGIKFFNELVAVVSLPPEGNKQVAVVRRCIAAVGNQMADLNRGIACYGTLYNSCYF